MGRRWWCGLLLTTHDDHHRRPTFTPEGDVMTAKWDEMWGLWVPTTTGGLIR